MALSECAACNRGLCGRCPNGGLSEDLEQEEADYFGADLGDLEDEE